MKIFRLPTVSLAVVCALAAFVPPSQAQDQPKLMQDSYSCNLLPTLPQTSPATLPNTLNGIQEFKLPNGLTVLLKEVRVAPVVYFSVWFKVGSADEPLGQTGMSHLLEHMLFKGTKTRKPGEISAGLQESGAEFNATTFFDRTNYYETLASDRLEMAMDIESDRMVNSLFDPEEHRKEMTVVRSEYESGENDPGTVLDKAVRLAAYQVHPYRWTTIGFRSDIENTSRNEMLAFYKKFYVPNNATIVMVGDFDTARAMEMVRKYFGSIPARPIPPRFITPEPEQQGERRVIVRRAGSTRQVQMAFHIPAFGHPDRLSLQVLQMALSGGRTSRFFQSMVQTGLASSASAYDYSLRQPDLMFVDAYAQPGKTNAELEKALLTEIETLKTTLISPEELRRVLTQAEAGYVYAQDSVQAQGAQIGENAMRGNWRFGETYLENLRRVSPQEVQRVAQKYLVERNRTVGHFEPIVESDTKPAARTSAVREPAAKMSVPRAAQVDASSPGRRPSSSASSGAISKPTRVVLENGVTVIVQENRANPNVALRGALLSSGSIFDPKGKPGLASFTASQFSRGTTTRSLLDIARTLEDLGISAGIGTEEEYGTLSGRSLSRDFDNVLEILADQLRNPAFPVDELEQERRQSLSRIEQARQDTSTLARIAFMNSLYPEGHPYHRPTLDEQAEVLKSLTREDLIAFHRSHYGPERLVLTVVGDVDTDKAVESVKKFFGGWKRHGNLPSIKIPDSPIPTGPLKTRVITLADKAQADVILGYAGNLKRSDPDFYGVSVLNTILGGGAGLSSRLALGVRDRLGLVYGISAGNSATLGAGPFSVEFGVNPQNVQPVLTEVQRQIEQTRDKGVSREEVEKAISYLTGSYAVTLSSNGAVASELLVGEVFGLGLDYIQKRNGYYKAITPQQVNEAARKYLRSGQGTLVIAGSYSAPAGS